MTMSLNKNCILIGVLDYFCLVCEKYLKSEVDADEHIGEAVHQKKLDSIQYVEEFKMDKIRKIKNKYFCELCNKLLSVLPRVCFHITELTHLDKKGGLLRRYGNFIIVFKNVVISEQSWHSLQGNACAICDVEYDTENEDLHKKEFTHILNVIQIQVQFHDNQNIYRKIDNVSFQCLTCNMLCALNSLTLHFAGNEHKKLYQDCCDAYSMIPVEIQTKNLLDCNETCEEIKINLAYKPTVQNETKIQEVIDPESIIKETPKVEPLTKIDPIIHELIGTIDTNCKDTVNSTPGENCRETVNSTPGENCRETVNSTPDENCRETVNSTPDENCRETVNSTPGENCRETVNSTPDENCRGTVNSTPGENCRETVNSTPGKNCRETVNSTPDENCRENVNSTPDENCRETVNSTPDENCRETVNITPGENCRGTVNSTPGENCRETVKSSPGENCRETVNSAPGENCRETVNSAPGENCRETVNSAPDENCKETVNSAPDENCRETVNSAPDENCRETVNSASDENCRETVNSASDENCKETVNSAPDENCRETVNSAPDENCRETVNSASDENCKETVNSAPDENCRETVNSASDENCKETVNSAPDENCRETVNSAPDENCRETVNSASDENCKETVNSAPDENCRETVNSAPDENCREPVNSASDENCKETVNSAPDENCRETVNSVPDENCRETVNSALDENCRETVNSTPDENCRKTVKNAPDANCNVTVNSAIDAKCKDTVNSAPYENCKDSVNSKPDANSKDSVNSKPDANYKDSVNNAPNDSYTKEEQNEDAADILDKLNEYQKEHMNVNFESNTAYCKKCNTHIDFVIKSIESHIMDCKEKYINTPITFNVNDIVPDNTNKILFNFIEFPSKERDVVKNGDTKSSIIKVQTPKTKKPKINLIRIPYNDFVQTIFVVQYLMYTDLLVNEKYCVNYASIHFMVQLSSGYRCLLCGEVLQRSQKRDHLHKSNCSDYVKRSSVIGNDDTEFIREIPSGSFHCGYCNCIEPSWDLMVVHLRSSAHKESKASATWRRTIYLDRILQVEEYDTIGTTLPYEIKDRTD